MVPDHAHSLTLTDYRQRAEIIQREAAALVIDSEAADLAAVQLLGAIATLRKAAEVKRTELVSPYNKEVAEINAAFRDVLAPVLTADATLRKHSLAWRQAEKARADQARRAAVLAQQAADAMLREAERADTLGDSAAVDSLVSIAAEQEQAAGQSAQEATPPAATIRTAFGTRTFRHDWAFEVTNPEMVPREYLEVNEARIRLAIRNGAREIAGLRIYPTETVVVGGR